MSQPSKDLERSKPSTLSTLTLKSNFCDWSYDMESHFFAKNWEQIYAWMTGKVWLHEDLQDAASPVLASAPPDPNIVPGPPAIVVPATKRVHKRKGPDPAPPIPVPIPGPPAAAVIPPKPSAPVPKKPALPKTPEIPGTADQRRKAWGALTSCIGADVKAKMTHKPRIGDLVHLWSLVQDCFFRATAISRNSIKMKMFSLTCVSAGGPEKFISQLQDYFDMLSRAGEPVSDSDKVFHFLRGLPLEFDSFKVALDVNDSQGSAKGKPFDAVMQNFHTYLQRNYSKDSQQTLSESQTTMFSNGNPTQEGSGISKMKAPCRNFLAGKCTRESHCRYSHDAQTAKRQPPPCRNFAKGSCTRSVCRFSHSLTNPITPTRFTKAQTKLSVSGDDEDGFAVCFAASGQVEDSLTAHPSDGKSTGWYHLRWCFDGGSTVHITNDLTGCIPGSLRDRRTTVRMANKDVVLCHQIADIEIQIRMPDSSLRTVRLLDVVVMHQAPCCLISESRLNSARLAVVKTEGICLVFAPETKEIVMTGSLGTTKGLYFLTTPESAAVRIPDTFAPLFCKPELSSHTRTPPLNPMALEFVPSNQGSQANQLANMCQHCGGVAVVCQCSSQLTNCAKCGGDSSVCGCSTTPDAENDLNPASGTNSLSTDQLVTLAQTYSEGIDSITLHHYRTCHRNFGECSAMIGASKPVKPIFCAACAEGKAHTQPLSKISSSQRAPRRAWMIHCDLCGPMSVETLSHKLHAAIFVDDYSRYAFIMLLRFKSDFFESFQFFLRAIENETDAKVAFLQTDGDGIFLRDERLAALCATKGIRHIYSTPFCPAQNGRAERIIRTIVEMARTSMIHGSAPRSLWGEAMSHAVYVYNRLPHSAIPAQYTCPLSAWRSVPIENPFRTLRVPFCLAYAKINGHLTKFETKATACVLLGCDSQRNCYRLLRLSDRSVVYSRDVTCNESQLPFRKPGNDKPPSFYEDLFPPTPTPEPDRPWEHTPAENLSPTTTPVTRSRSSKYPASVDPTQLEEPNGPSNDPRTTANGRVYSKKTPKFTHKGTEITNSSSDFTKILRDFKENSGDFKENVTQMLNEVQKQHDLGPAKRANEEKQVRFDLTSTLTTPPRSPSTEHADDLNKLQGYSPGESDHINNDDMEMIDQFKDLVASCEEVSGDPKNYHEACSGPDASAWKKACIKEMVSQAKKHKSLKSVIIPDSSRVIPTAWRFKRKQNSHSGDFTFKARLIVRGDRMIPPEFGETFAPVARWVSLRTIFAVATQLDLETEGDDVETAFLLAEMDTIVYVSFPPGFKHLFPPPREPLRGEKHACQLMRSIPGIRQGSRLFWQKLLRDLRTIGYKPTGTDPCILQYSEGREKHIIGLWVDDLIHAHNSPRLLLRCRSSLRAAGYTLVSKANLEWHLGMRICRNLTNHSTTMDTESLIEKAAIKFGFSELKPAFTPAPPNTILDKPQKTPSRHASFQYRTIAATTLYVSVVGRPDTSYPSATACRFMDNWGDEHAEYLIHVWRYLYHTRQRKLRYLQCPQADWKLFGYSDSSWADILTDRTSTMGYVFFLGSCLVAWSSKKQRSVALSSNHAEYVSLGEASREGIFLAHLLTDIGQSIACTPFTMASDSLGAMALAQHPLSTKRNKHLDTALHWIREAIENNIFVTVKMDTTEMIADVNTKPLGRVLFNKFSSMMMGEVPVRHGAQAPGGPTKATTTSPRKSPKKSTLREPAGSQPGSTSTKRSKTGALHSPAGPSDQQ